MDRIIFCVPNKKIAKKFETLGKEVWNAEIEPWEKTITVSNETHQDLVNLGRKDQSFSEIIAELIIECEYYAGGLYYKFYEDGENMVYITSVDNQTWSPPTTVNVAPITELAIAKENEEID